jgi:hypothetical protein
VIAACLDANAPRAASGSATYGSMPTDDGLRQMSLPQPEFDRHEVIVCMIAAFALAGASVTIIYRIMG